MNMPTVVIADSHSIVRAGLTAILEREGCQVVGVVSTAASIIQHLADLKPDVLIMDFMSPDRVGIEILRRIRSSGTVQHTIVFSSVRDAMLVGQALALGAMGYISKEAPLTTLVQGLRSVLSGNRYVDPSLKVLNGTADAQSDDVSGGPLDKLSNREREILQLVVNGMSSVSIAQQLRISPHTVEKHRANIRTKLGSHNLSDLLRLAIREGLSE